MISLNEVALNIAAEEGGKKNVSIAQIKEVLKITLNLLSKEQPSDVLKLLETR